jgi:ABC-type lipoprotein release transport system permease subunit
MFLLLAFVNRVLLLPVVVIAAAVAVTIVIIVAVLILLLLLLYSFWEELITQVYAIILNLTSSITSDNLSFLTLNG